MSPMDVITAPIVIVNTHKPVFRLSFCCFNTIADKIKVNAGVQRYKRKMRKCHECKNFI